jgi:hypothetical protein
MAESMSGPVSQCPWCSAPLPDPAVERCPSCGAHLAATGAEGEIKGVTTLDTEAILRARSEVGRPRSRILSFITGEVVPETGDGPASPESLAPPPDDVRREMLRLQLEAERADLAAETVALKSDELAKRGIHLSEIGVDEAVLAEPVAAPAVGATDAGQAPAAQADAVAAPAADALPAATPLPSTTALPATAAAAEPAAPAPAVDAEEPPATA